MFTWWNQNKNSSAAKQRRFRPVVESLERRETPAAAVSVGPIVNISQAIANQKDQTVAINPTNPNNVVAFANIEDITGDGTADPGLFSAYSFDGGQTWNTQYLFTDTTLLDVAGATTSGPRAAFDRFGNLFLAYTTRANDIAVAYSVDGGQSFFSQVLTADGLNGQLYLATGPSGRQGIDAVWISYRVNASANAVVPAPHIETTRAFTVSLGGVSPFRAPVLVPGSESVNPNQNTITIGPRGQVMVAYQSNAAAVGPSQMFANVDPDGVGLAGWGPRRLITATNVGFTRVIPANGATSSISAAPSLAWDRSGRANNGRVYFVYVSAPNTTSNDTDVFLRFSDDRGVTWSAPVRVNDASANSQFLPAVAVDQATGVVAVSWYDARNSGNNTLTQVFAAVSDDGGATFRNFQVSAGQINAAASAPPSTSAVSSGVGLFNQISFVGGNLQINWSDNSAVLPGNPDPTRMDVATARVRVAPIFRVKVLFPTRWRLIDAVNGVYFGRMTIINNTGFTLRGPFQLTITLRDPSMSFSSPPNTQSGTTVTFTINANLRNRVPLRIGAVLNNPLRLKLPTALIGFATSLA